MQNAGQQYGQGGGVSSHQTTTNSNFGHTESSSITSSLRQFRRKPEDKHPPQELNPQPQQAIPDSHVARVAPHSHYPSTARPGDCYRYPPQYPEYSVPSQVKYSEISEPHQPIQEHVPPPSSVIQKAKGKDYMDMCSIQQSHVMKQPYPEHMGPQQPYADHNILPQSQYIPKEAQIHSLYKQQESQYFPKDQQFPGQLPHQMQKYNVPSSQLHKDFLSQLQKIHPTMARAIMNDHQMKEPPRPYQNIEQNRLYNQPRYVNHPSSPIQGNIYPHGYGPPPPPQAAYQNYPSSCSYTRAQQMPPRFPPINPHERSISPRRNYSDGMNMAMNYPTIPQKIPSNYPQYNSTEYPQHFQQRRSMSQEYYQQHCRPAQYIPHQLPTQDLPDAGRVTVSDNIKQYIENWADEETATEMNQIENNRLCKENVRAKEGQSNETIYAINASDLQYLEPIVAAENGIPVVTSENGQYILKSGVSLDNSSGMLRLVDKNDLGEQQGERVVNLQIMDSSKPDCMLAGAKPTADPAHCNVESDKSRIVIHQNTVIQSSLAKEKDAAHEQASLEEELNQTIIREHRRETMDKNCSPINLEQTLNDEDTQHKVMYPSKKVVEEITGKNMPIIENTSEQAEDLSKSEGSQSEAQLTETDIVPFEESRKVDLAAPPDTDEEKESREPPSPSVSPPSTVEEEPTEPTTDEVEHTEMPQDKEKPSSSDQLEMNENPVETKTIIEENKDSNDLESLDLSMKYNPQEESKPKRTRRFFSVDDIINNIGSSMAKSSRESEERRHSIHTTAEFLNKEVHNTFVQTDQTNKIEDSNKSDDCEENMTRDVKVEASVDITPAAKDGNDEKLVVPEVAGVLDHIKTEIEDTNESDTEDTETISNVTKDHDEAVTDEASVEPKDSPASRREPKVEQEIQYRNIIRVDESNVVLHIAGELVEVNVHTVNGKKMITVVPLSSSTVADLNDNYETLDGNEAATERDGEDKDGHVDYNDGTKPELASEVIIGMDLSLEEEIQLDLEQPQVISTKAARKAYDCDLQIPSITTSEDVFDDNDTQSFDKIGLSKEKDDQSAPAAVSEVKTELDDDEFVPFKDLIKARKLRKMRMKASKNEIKADSTNKIDEVISTIKKEHSLKRLDKNEPEGAKRISFSESTDSHPATSKEPGRKSPTISRVVTEQKGGTLAPTSHASKNSSGTAKELKSAASASKGTEHKNGTLTQTSPASKDSSAKEHKSATSSKVAAARRETEHKSGTIIQTSPVLKDSSGTAKEHKSATTSKVVNSCKETECKSGTLVQTSTSKETERKLEQKSASRMATAPKEPEHKSDTSVQITPASKDSSVTVKEHKSSKSSKTANLCKETECKSGALVQTSPVSKDSSLTAKEHKSAKSSRVETPCKETEVTGTFSPSFKDSSAAAKEHKSATSSRGATAWKEAEHKSGTSIQTSPVFRDSSVITREHKSGASSSKEAGHKSGTTSPVSRDSSVTTREHKSGASSSKEAGHKSGSLIQTSPVSRDLERKSVTTSEHKSTISFRVATACKESEYKSTTVIQTSNTSKDAERKSTTVIQTSNTSKDVERTSTTTSEHKSPTLIKISLFCKESEHKSATASEYKSTTSIRVEPFHKLEQKSGTGSHHKNPKSSTASLEKTETKKKLSLEEYNRRKRKVPESRAVEKAPPSKRARDDMHVTPSPAKVRHHRKSLDESKYRAEVNSLKRTYEGAVKVEEERPWNRFDDEQLRLYKEQVEYKLSSLNIQIPRVKYSNSNQAESKPVSEEFTLMDRFLRSEQLTTEEIHEVVRIVSCKRFVEKIRSATPAGQHYEVNKEPGDRETKLHLRKLPDKKRFRNLYGDSSTETDSDDSKNRGDYSVVQSNCHAGVVPKLIIKRKTEATMPFVKLERLDMSVLIEKKYAD